ncbi:MAG TPA: SPFH domain-containing protein, partial [Spirochaetota bacterium]|nr:SPFH domain-containing protein [Spirochaetota bacterium]
MFDLGLIPTLIFLILLILIPSIKIIKEYERAVIFRLGRLLAPPKGPKGPGLIFVIPFIDKFVRVNLRLVAMDVPPQDIITRDNVSVKVNAVVYFRVIEPNKAITEVD